MIVSIIVFVVACVGIYWLMGSIETDTTSSAKAAVLARSPDRLTLSNRLTKFLSSYLIKYIILDEYRKETLVHNLSFMRINQSPEEYIANLWAKSATYGCMGFALIPLVVLLSGGWLLIPLAVIGITVGCYFSSYDKMQKAVEERKEQIEIELPNFANTIRQSLNTTRDVMQIFKSYRKICGVQLREEIDKTLNDMYTGNAERALSDFDRRISSAKLSELIRGLISVNRGDDQKVYFDILAHDYQLAAEEAITRNIEKNSDKLKPYSFLCVGCMALMYIAGIGASMLNQLSNML